MEEIVHQDADWLSRKFFHAYVHLGEIYAQPDTRQWEDLSDVDKNRLRATFRELLARGVLTAWPHREIPTQGSGKS